MKSKHPIVKYLIIAAGTVSLGLGVLGLFLPLLPTTPLLLLAAFCYVRSSDKLHHWLLYNKLTGARLRRYIEYRAITKLDRFTTLVVLWGSLIASCFVVNQMIVTIILLIVGIAVTIHVSSLKTFSPENDPIQ